MLRKYSLFPTFQDFIGFFTWFAYKTDNYLYIYTNILKKYGSNYHIIYCTHPFWDWVLNNFRQTIVIPGNHEFYIGGDVGTIKNGCIVEIRSNVKGYYNTVVTVDDVDFILCTLWAFIQSENAFITQKNVYDFYQIAYNGRLLNPHVFNQAHQEAVTFLMNAVIVNGSKKIIVVSHHVPTELCKAEEFKKTVVLMEPLLPNCTNLFSTTKKITGFTDIRKETSLK